MNQAVVCYANLHEWRMGDEDDDPVNNRGPSFEYGTRIPFLTVSGPPGSRVIDQAVPPHRALGGSFPVTPLSPVIPKVSSNFPSHSKSTFPLITKVSSDCCCYNVSHC